MFRAIPVTAVALIAALLVSSGVSRAESGYSFSATVGKLPKTVVPAHYAIDLKPDLTTLAVSGSEVVDIKVLQPTDRLVLNALDMVLRSASLDGEAGQVAAITSQPKAQTVTLSFPHPLAAGPHKLRIAFTGRINSFGRGLFVVDYPTGSSDTPLAATESAMQCAPCSPATASARRPHPLSAKDLGFFSLFRTSATASSLLLICGNEE